MKMEEEAMISGLIQNLETSHVACTDIKSRGILEAKMKELREMFDFLRDLKMEDKSKLKYLMADLVESAQSVEDMSSLHFTQALEYYKSEIESTKMRMINFGAAQDKIGGDEEKEQVVVGLENVVQMLLDKAVLNNSSWPPHLSIWNIKGMIGIGKTTLSRKVYNHKDVVSRFERRGWVSISNDMSYKEVLVELIQQMVVGSEEQLIGRDSLLEGKDNRSLRQMLRQHLQGKRFFIVFDNLLKGMCIRRILRGLGDKDADHPGSRILCTSRYEVEGIYHTHNMKPLDSDKSWQLFLNTIFPGDTFASGKKEFSKELVRKGKEMLKKCGGLPPAIIDVARQKAKQRLSGMEWEQLFDSIDLSESLKLSEPMYQTLGEELKLCFLCMSFFKENAIMREEKLEQIWAASGIKSLDKLTRGIFGGPCADLVKESIIEVVHEFLFKDEVKRCHMNPVLHMLSIKKAEEEIGFEILKSNGNSQTSQNPRHRVIHCGRDKFDHSKNQANKNLNSLILHGGGCYLDDASLSYWESFELLKILDMDDFGVKTLSETISTLTELRYLGLRNNYIQEIPHSFRGFKKLEVLDIDLNFMVDVPDIIWEMDSLRTLHMADVICRKPLKIDALEYLETLTYISIHDCIHEASILETNCRLQKLGIEEVDENSDVGNLFSSLGKLEFLRHLILKGFRFRSMPCLDEIGVLDRLETVKLYVLLPWLPSGDNFPRVRYIVLVNTCLDKDPMPVLKTFRCLKRLKLRNAYTGREMVIVRGLLRLEILRINELWNLRKIQVERALLSLKQLEINCPHLETLPQELMKYLMKFKMVTTNRIQTKIRNSGLTSEIPEVDFVCPLR